MLESIEGLHEIMWKTGKRWVAYTPEHLKGTIKLSVQVDGP